MSETSGENDRGRWQTTGNDQERPSMRVVDAVATEMGVDPVALDPLFDVVDPDALDCLFDSDVDGSVHFEYHGHDVVVFDDGRVTVGGSDERGV